MKLHPVYELPRPDCETLIAEIALLARDGWRELGFRDEEFAPNLPQLLAMWKHEFLHIFTARDEGEVARGYLLWSKAPHLLSADLTQASMVGIYLQPGARGFGNAEQFARFTIEVLKGQGIKRFLTSVPIDGPAGETFKALGFTALETLWELRRE